jgi:recombinational DNA repair ATPase RecF
MPDPTPTPRTGLQLLIDWANEQDHWVRAIVTEVIAARRALSDASVAAAYDMFLAEKGLSSAAPPAAPLLAQGATATENTEELRLTRLSNVTGVNALATGQEIRFNPRLTVLFGENAAGKTGYVRVLKRVASVRSAEEILGNVHASQAGKPHATIEYELSGAAKTLEWNDDTGVPPFTRMSVLDSSAVALHVDDDLTYVFTPGELALFQNVHRAMDAVKTRLEREKAEASPKAANPFLHRFQRDAVVYPKIETLGPSTSVAELEKLGTLSAEEEGGLAALRDRVEALQPRSAETRLQVATADRDLYASVLAAAKAAETFGWDDYNAAVEAARRANDAYVATSKTAFTGEDVPGLFGEAWREFVAAGDAYLRATGRGSKPAVGDACPYCRQELDAKALALLQKYHEYCNNEPRKALDAATKAVERIAAPIVALPVAATKDACERRRSGLGDPAKAPAALTASLAFLGRLDACRAALVAGRQVAELDVLRRAAAEAARDTALEVEKAKDAVVALRKQAEERKQELEAETAKLRVLENRLTLRGILSEVRAYVERAQWASRAAPLVNRITAVMRGITEQSKIASKELLDRDFERLFQAECVALRAPKVRLDFAGRKGQSARKKTLAADHRLSEILSEGEQKVIALADFLAEAALHRTTAPVVFDDPVNSLDYKRLREVVDRIELLSATRQVIVFTHNIWFATELLSRFEDRKQYCTYYGVSESEGRTGFVVSGTHPRWDTVKDLTGRINQLVQAAGPAAGEVQAALVENAYSHLRGWCEVVVEQELLQGVTQRYQPNVSMGKFEKIKVEKLAAARAVLVPIFEKACRVITAHSQPLETLSVRPTLADLKKDWLDAQAARNAYLAA